MIGIEEDGLQLKAEKTLYKSIFVSDIHLGVETSKIDLFLDFLEYTKCENLYIVGDFIDFFHMYEHHGWSSKCNLVLRRILNKLRKGTKVKICVGNHDAFLGILNGFRFGNMEIGKEFIHEGRFLVLHGDIFDHSMHFSFVVKILAFIYNHFTWVPWMNGLKKLADMLSERSMNEEGLIDYAKQMGVGGVIYGHTHKPDVRDGFIYNCGDWVKNCTALVEKLDGDMELIKWKSKDYPL